MAIMGLWIIIDLAQLPGVGVSSAFTNFLLYFVTNCVIEALVLCARFYNCKFCCTGAANRGYGNLDSDSSGFSEVSSAGEYQAPMATKPAYEQPTNFTDYGVADDQEMQSDEI